ncbi:hypothetical protein JK386_16465 [Nocardioides sp. zg-536]|uniref:EfeO-type cupredoxin-like domain-containing protein n=1 Tax=Nocardioides faecalis TaxID=2803858 RepID=A0A939BUB4_9ACTN|nr:hypothetical protein [Nocardioides faecalis]MBM9461499.1 hypothetical protein [Nocardioides faecalis]MBS4752591.1 hypothetical protein [Nocardioides faecalis]QVI57870.1 hypothetical protein KG111_12500 [Nocardioides faecalis]
MQWLRTSGALVAALALTATLSACGDEEKSPSGEPVVVEITVSDGKIEPSGERVEVGAGEPIDLVVTADEPGSIHIHSDPEQELAYEAGTKTFPIQIDRPGVVEVESHDPDQIIVQLEVR